MIKNTEITKKKKRHVEDKNICITNVRGVKKYCVNVTLPNKKRKKAYFNTKEEARNWLKQYRLSIGIDLSDFSALSPSKLADIRFALSILPIGASLSEIVSDYNARHITKSITIESAFIEYKNALQSLLIGQFEKGTNKPKKIKLRIAPYFTVFKNWDVDSNEVLKWLLERGKPKTIKEYTSELKRFFEWSKRRNYCILSPFDNIAATDLPKILRAKIGVFELNEIQAFFEYLEEKHPDRVSWFAVACFCGIRRAEINRLNYSNFDKENKRITLPYEIVKTGDTWIMENLPDNMWIWLDKYGYKFPKMHNKFFDSLVTEFESIANFKWQYNICRHSFCTYHLSLYRDPTKTAILLRHRNPNTLWQHYLAGLVSKETAEEYFAIKPTHK